jgi:heavy metal sensor kinase
MRAGNDAKAGRAVNLPLPIRLKLTLWFFSIFAVATLALLSACLWMVHRSILELETNELQQRVRSVQRFLDARPRDASLGSERQAFAVFDVMHGGKWLQVVDQDGNWIYRSKSIVAAFPRLALPQALTTNDSTFEFEAVGSHVRGMIEPIKVHGRSYAVQTGLSLNKTLVILGDFRRQLAILTPFVLLLAAGGGYLMSRKALAPVAAITAEARRINDKNLRNRLPILYTRDELADMSETLNEMLDRIESGYRSVREFTANAAHELRTPVSLICTETEVSLAFQRSAEEYRDTCEHIQQESRRMGNLIDVLLALARADAGAEGLRMEALDLNDLAQDARRRWTAQIEKTPLTLTVCRTTGQSRVFADAAALKRLLDVLIDNAWRYTPRGGEISIGVSRDGDYVNLFVSDTGIGIKAEDQPRIFDRFYRAGRPQNGAHRGSGLGLALATWIAEKHQTKINVTSESGRGSCFSIGLPALPVEADPRFRPRTSNLPTVQTQEEA